MEYHRKGTGNAACSVLCVKEGDHKLYVATRIKVRNIPKVLFVKQERTDGAAHAAVVAEDNSPPSTT